MNAQTDITSILISIPGALLAVIVHEFVKSMAAFKVGDFGVKDAGRLSLNPKKHVDPLGAILLVLFGYGWTNPVKLTPFQYKERKKAVIIVFAIPFIVSFLMGVAFLAGANMWANYTSHIDRLFSENAEFYLSILRALLHIATINIGLALTSLIPVFPYNGAFVLNTFSPMTGAKLMQHERIFQTIIALLIIFGVFHIIINPVVWHLFNIL